ncbi:MAG: SAF domain-containing protein [Mycobacteriales bacterium]
MPDRPARKPHRPRWLSPRRQHVIHLGPWPRRALALALLGLAVILALRPSHRARVATGPMTTVVVAAHALTPGHRIAASDVRLASWPTRLVPAGAARGRSHSTGGTVAGPVPAGGVLTDLSTVGPSLAQSLGGSGATAVPVRVTDPGLAQLLHPGDGVDVLAGRPGQRVPSVVAERVRVLVVLAGPRDDVSIDGITIMVAAQSDTARRLALIPQDARVGLVLRPD